MQEKIAFLTFQTSIVVKGLEKRLRDAGYNVETYDCRVESARVFGGWADVFVLYLPSDMSHETLADADIAEVLKTIHENKNKAILIGEHRDHEEYLKAVPWLNWYLWINRPVDTEKLMAAIAKTVAASATETAPANVSASPDAPASAAVPSSVSAALNPGSVKKILIVDDDPVYAKTIRMWLKDFFQINIVTAGVQAITFLAKNKVDLILLDYEMPVVDGPQVLEMLKSEPETAGIPVVFLTGIGTRESIQRVMGLKPAGYILKTTTRDDLVTYLMNLFNKH